MAGQASDLISEPNCCAGHHLLRRLWFICKPKNELPTTLSFKPSFVCQDSMVAERPASHG